ncbi:MAG: 50S ribosomal protein L11 methyltransferase [Phycisphaeraceae bacterium]|nr:50S ribosomal protein L11 methyltransferase [Phycisphaeraceae bacterium]
MTDPPLELLISEKAFRPNPTTVRFGRAVQVAPGDTVFDIGTGIGPLAIKAGLDGAERVVAVDPVALHCELARLNAAKYGLADRISVYQGDWFDPFDREAELRSVMADVIIGDVSGIADGVARALGWYSDQVPTGGIDGTGPILTLLARAADRLRPGGTLYFPVATDLSDGDRILAAAAERFETVRNAFEKPYFEFPLSDADVVAIEGAYTSEGGMPGFVQIQKGRRPFWRGQILAASGPR